VAHESPHRLKKGFGARYQAAGQKIAVSVMFIHRIGAGLQRAVLSPVDHTDRRFKLHNGI